MYGSSLRLVTRTPREARIAASDAAAMPFPNEETTPPVTNTNLGMGDKVPEIRHSTGTRRAHAAAITRQPRSVRREARLSDARRRRRGATTGRLRCAPLAQPARRAPAASRARVVSRPSSASTASIAGVSRVPHDEHAQRHHHLRRLQRVLRRGGLDRGADRLARPLDGREFGRELGQRRPVAVVDVLGDRLGRGMRRRVEVVRGVGHLGERRDPVAQQHRDRPGGRSRARVEPGALEVRREAPTELGLGQPLHVLLVHPLELVGVESRRRGTDRVEVEPRDELLAREDLVVAVRPAEPREEVDDRLGQVAQLLVLHHAHRAVPLRELLPVLAQHGRHVRVHGRLRAERADDVDLPRRVVDVVVAADHVRDPHVEVVDDDAEVVGRRAVRARDHEVVELRVGDLDAPLDAVVPRDAAGQRIPEADHRRDARRRRHPGGVLGPPAAVVARLLAARHLRGAQGVELGGRHVAVVGEPALEHLGERPRDSGPSAASGRTDPRRSRARARPSRRGSPAPPPASSARRRCPRCAG